MPGHNTKCNCSFCKTERYSWDRVKHKMKTLTQSQASRQSAFKRRYKMIMGTDYKP